MLSYLELSQEALLHNIGLFRSLLSPTVKIAFPVKGNAYGHGLEEIVRMSEQVVDYFMIDDVEELRRLRTVSAKPTLVMGYVEKAALEELLESNGILVVYDVERIQLLDHLGKKFKKIIPIHLKIDVFHGRQGILLNEVDKYISLFRQSQFIKLEGIAAHFSSSDDLQDFLHTQKQITEFRKIKQYFENKGFKNLASHISNTGGILTYDKNNPENVIVRPGIGLYGMWPSAELKKHFSTPSFTLQAVARWVSHVAQVKTLPMNHPVGYNRTFITTKPTKMALIPQGYSDGYDRGLSNCGEVLIKGSRCKVLGRVAMNMFSVDVSHLSEVHQEDEVVLLGNQGTEEITAEEIAEKIGTINYEITTRISALLPKIISSVEV